MTVAELITVLEQFDKELQVFVFDDTKFYILEKEHVQSYVDYTLGEGVYIEK